MSLRLAWWVVARVSNPLLASASSRAPASAAPSVGSVPLPTWRDTQLLAVLYPPKVHSHMIYVLLVPRELKALKEGMRIGKEPLSAQPLCTYIL